MANPNLAAPTSTPTPPPPEAKTIKRYQHLNLKRTRTPLFKRVLVYNYSEKTVRVTPEKTLRTSLPPSPPPPPHIPNSNLPPRPLVLAHPTHHHCHRLRLPFPCPGRLTIFVDSETESIPSLRNVSPEGEGNVELVSIFLNMMGWRTGVLRRFGGLRVLYVVGDGDEEEERRG